MTARLGPEVAVSFQLAAKLLSVAENAANKMIPLGTVEVY